MRPSSIDKLEAPIREEINRLRIDKGYTIEQIVGHLKAMEITISKSAMGRHVQKIEAVGAKIKEARAIAEGIAPQLDDDGKSAALNIELLQAAVLQLMAFAETEDGGATPNARELMFLAKSLKDLAGAQKINADRILKVRQEIGKSVKKKIEGIAADVDARDAASAVALLKRIREEVYGMFDEPAK